MTNVRNFKTWIFEHIKNQEDGAVARVITPDFSLTENFLLNS